MTRLGLFIAALMLLTGASFDGAKADPYRWCASLTIDRGGSNNCWFVTFEQCRATVSGVGGYCVPNPFYDGRNGTVVTRRGKPRA